MVSEGPLVRQVRLSKPGSKSISGSRPTRTKGPDNPPHKLTSFLLSSSSSLLQQPPIEKKGLT